MKLYVWGPAPNPRRVKMYLAEKGLTVEWHLLKLLWMTMFSDAGSGERAWLS
ncbi:MAG: hypothetical protein ACKVQA_25455 [Burkholderiales bacterium]